jgi:hypothetical protein
MKKNNWMLGLLALTLAAALALPALAKPVSRNIKVSQPFKFGKAQYDAGVYRLLIDGTRVTVYKDRAIVAQLEGRWESRDARPRYDSYLLNRRGELEEVRFAGDHRVLVLVQR